MSKSQWHRFYKATVGAGPEVVFDLLADMPNYGRWLPRSEQFAGTTDVEPYPVRLGSRYRDGRPGEIGKEWRGSVVGFRPAITSRFDKENLRTMAAVKRYAEAHAGEGGSGGGSQILSIIPM